ncbi:MAG: nuclear transport factor 2 family protein [Deltaproteobacteria bacterium]|nr:nuclear transport factor 2 family protein [Deltaproteobacteria bacterium]
MNDHRLLGFVTLLGVGALHGPAVWIQTLRSLVDLAPDVLPHVDQVRTSDHGTLAQFAMLGTRDGSAFEIPQINVSELDELGRIHRLDVYDLDQLDQARARFDAIGAQTASDPLAAFAQPNAVTAATPATRFANAATRAWDRMFTFWRARDWQRFAQPLSVGFRYVDRRRMAQLELDRDRFVEFTRQLGDMSSARLETEVLATRGDRLALLPFHVEVADAEIGPSELEYVNLIEMSESDEVVMWVRFDVDDLDAAYAELDARYDAGEAAAHARASAWLRGFLRAFANRDWDTLPALCAPTLVADDHRLVGWGTLRGPAAWVQALRALVDLASDARYHLDHVRLSDRGWLAEGAMRGTRDGGMFEIPSIAVGELDELGKQLRGDLYELDQFDQARARFDAIGASTTRDPLAAFAKPNAATAAMDRLQAAFDARDWPGVRAACTPDAWFEDRRRQALVSGDIDLWLADMRGMPVLAPNMRFARSLIGAAGERLALERHLWSGGPPDGPVEIEGLFLVEVDETG